MEFCFEARGVQKKQQVAVFCTNFLFRHEIQVFMYILYIQTQFYYFHFLKSQIYSGVQYCTTEAC